MCKHKWDVEWPRYHRECLVWDWINSARPHSLILFGAEDNWTETPEKGQERKSWEDPLKPVCLKSALSSSPSCRNMKRISICVLPTMCQVLLHPSFCYIITITLQGRCLPIRKLSLARINDLPKVICSVGGKPWFLLRFVWFLKLCPNPCASLRTPLSLLSYLFFCPPRGDLHLLQGCLSHSLYLFSPW